MKLYIIRHGETDWNVKRRFQGHSDIPLNEEGRRLAYLTAEALKAVPFTRIYTSPLKRGQISDSGIHAMGGMGRMISKMGEISLSSV